LLTINWTHCLTSISNLVKIPIPYLEFIHPTRCESSSSQKKKKKKGLTPDTYIKRTLQELFFKEKDSRMRAPSIYRWKPLKSLTSHVQIQLPLPQHRQDAATLKSYNPL
jgi:hypothetical protein